MTTRLQGPEIQVVTEESAASIQDDVDNLTPVTATASAPEGFVVTGGGVDIDRNDGSPPALLSSMPVGDSWVGAILCTRPGQHITAYAICVASS